MWTQQYTSIKILYWYSYSTVHTCTCKLIIKSWVLASSFVWVCPNMFALLLGRLDDIFSVFYSLHIFYSEPQILLTKSNKLYVWLTTYLKKSTSVAIISFSVYKFSRNQLQNPNENPQDKNDQINKHCQLRRWNLKLPQSWSSQVIM